MIAAQPSAIPEQGQIATVRQRRYVVTGIAPSSLPISPLAAKSTPQHLVTLNCIEDDGLGESLQVIWELEPEAQNVAGLDSPIKYSQLG